MPHIQQPRHRLTWLVSSVLLSMALNAQAQEAPPETPASNEPLPAAAPEDAAADATPAATESSRQPPPAEPTAASHAAAAPAGADAAAPDIDISAYLNSPDAAAAVAAAASDEASLRFYGFADFGFNYFTGEWKIPTAGETPAFFSGNLNLYAAADLSERWRSLAEIRFTFLPDGLLDSNFQRTSTASPDYANIGAQLRWGGISIERAWLEYSAHELLNIRAGIWLTPVGIWNVDHGSPAIIPVSRPFTITAALFPTRQAGIEIFGNRLFGETTLGYHLTISNGRGGISSYGDLDKNKALGWRGFVTFAIYESSLTLGFSGFAGRDTEADLELAGTELAPSLTAQFDEIDLAVDLLWKWEGLHLQAEYFSQQVEYTREGQVIATPPGPRGGVIPDYTKFGGYILLGYRPAMFPLMPYVEFDYITNVATDIKLPGAPNTVTSYVIGLNYRPIPAVALKGQYARQIFTPLEGKGIPMDAFMALFAWSF